MLLRLKVEGFKNLLDNEVFFGPFTCIAGANGVGKSNLFDAIEFLGMLAGQRSLLEAAMSVRSEDGRSSDYRQIFPHYGTTYGSQISFVADMLVPRDAVDEYGQKAKAGSPFVRYTLRLRLRGEHSSGPIEIVEEDLRVLRFAEFGASAPFHASRKWRDGVRWGKYKKIPLISTDGNKIKLHQDQKTGGKAQPFHAPDLPRTVLSRTIASESPTALCVRREMASWMLLHLEPNALRKPSSFTAPKHLSVSGEFLPAAIARLGEDRYQEIANSLAQLIDDVREIRIDKNDRRELFELLVKTEDGTEHPAQALSDGTLRFLALAVLAIDPAFAGLLCMEEPENGIHPERLAAMVELLQEIATDCDEVPDDGNPLRQVIINTHSPALVSLVPEDALVVAKEDQVMDSGRRVACVSFSGLEGTWRSRAMGGRGVSKGRLLSYLNPLPPPSDTDTARRRRPGDRTLRRVIDWYLSEQTSLLPLLYEERPDYDAES